MANKERVTIHVPVTEYVYEEIKKKIGIEFSAQMFEFDHDFSNLDLNPIKLRFDKIDCNTVRVLI